MRIGVKFPTREIGTDRGVIREWVRTAEGLGFVHICVIDHVLGVDPRLRPEWADHWPMDRDRHKPYDIDDEFHETFVLLGYLAGLTEHAQLTTGILISPQRQTALLAKQAAEVDLLSGGRVRLGLGVGWNAVEYEALQQDFRTRGRRIEEQVAVLRQLWTQPVVKYRGEFEHLDGVGIAPLPTQRPIPIWLGGFAPAALRRAGQLGDGWIAGFDPDAAARGFEEVQAAATSAGRPPGTVGLEGTINLGYGSVDADPEVLLERWQKAGATSATVDTMGRGLQGIEHVRELEGIASRLGLGAAS